MSSQQSATSTPVSIACSGRISIPVKELNLEVVQGYFEKEVWKCNILKGNIAHNESLQVRYMHCFKTAVYVLFVKFAFKLLTLHFRVLLSIFLECFSWNIMWSINP